MVTRKRPVSPMPARVQPTPRGGDRENKTRSGALLVTTPELDPLAYVSGLIRDVPDFPQPGILFRDITPLLADPRGFHIVLDALAHRFVGEHIDAVVGIESRGFIFGGALAAR